MKTLKYLFLGLAALAAVGCEQEIDYYKPSPDDIDVIFFKSNEISTVYPGDATGDQVLAVKAQRVSAAAAATVAVSGECGEGADEFFAIPESLTFAEGEYETTFEVTIKGVENLQKGQTYDAKISIEAKSTDNIQASGYTSVALHVSSALEWVPVYKLKDKSKLLSGSLTDADYELGADGLPIQQTGTFYYNSFFMGDDPGLTLERALGTNMFRINHIFYDVDFVFTIVPGDKVVFDGEEYTAIYADEQYIGYDHPSYGPVYCADERCYNDYKNNPCFWDGEDTFVFILGYFVSAGDFSYDQIEMFVLD